MNEAHDRGLIAAVLLDGKGGGQQGGWDDIEAWSSSAETLWIHMDYANNASGAWILERSGLEPTIAQALVAEETRPRSLATRGGLLVILRGANLNEGADADDMIAVRAWLEANRIITTRHRPTRAIEAIRASIETGDGPTSAGDFLVQMADGLTARASDAISDLEDEVDKLEDEVLSAESYDLRGKIAEFRRSAIRFRRYLAPQKDVLTRLQSERVEWLSEIDRAHLREIGDRTLRLVEDLDSARDRASVAQDELNNRLAEQMNRTMYVLSIVAGIFLPLGLLTGLLGINVGGMPGVDSEWAFIVVCILLLLTGLLLTAFFRRRGWI
jgi:zinc transporter